MAKKVLIISTSLRGGNNSDILARECEKGAREAGHEVEYISLKGKEIKYCIGCLACQTKGNCVLKDDVAEIMAKVKDAEVIVYATQHATPYTVQPLPVTDFAACLQPDGQVLLSWEATIDPLEPTAQPDGYIIYMRRDGEDYDQGTRIPSTAARINIEPDCIYSFKVCAYNEGGKSFESEELSVMRSSQEKAGVLIVNGFTRLSGPALVDNDEQRGFLLEKDLGVAYQYTPEYSGRQLNFNPRRCGRLKSTWIVPHCQSRPRLSFSVNSSFGP